jgi:hypothetical protein
MQARQMAGGEGVGEDSWIIVDLSFDFQSSIKRIRHRTTRTARAIIDCIAERRESGHG